MGWALYIQKLLIGASMQKHEGQRPHEVQVGPREPRTGPWGPWGCKMVPKSTKGCQKGAPKVPPELPKGHPRLPKGSQRLPKGSQRLPKEPQRRPKQLQNGAKMELKCLTWPPRRPGGVRESKIDQNSSQKEAKIELFVINVVVIFSDHFWLHFGLHFS